MVFVTHIYKGTLGDMQVVMWVACLSCDMTHRRDRLTFEPVDQFSWNLIWTLCHWRPPEPYTFQFPTIGKNSMVGTLTYEMGAMVAPLNKAFW